MNINLKPKTDASNLILHKNTMNEWPNDYPEALKKVSWHIGGKAGVFAFYNRYLDYSVKHSELFVGTQLHNLFGKHGVVVNAAFNEVIQYFCKSINVYFDEDECTFKCKSKYAVDKKTGKKQPVFDGAAWKKLCLDTECEHAKPAYLLKLFSQYLIAEYNKFIKM